MGPQSSPTRMQTAQSYATCVEQNLTTLSTAVDSCRSALHLLHDELLVSDNCMQYHAEQNRQYHHANLNLLQERDEMVREIERLRGNLVIARNDVQEIIGYNDMLQQRNSDLELAQKNHLSEAKNLNAKIASLEAHRTETRWPSPIRVKLPPYQGEYPLTRSPESSLDLNADGTELVNIMLKSDEGKI